MTEIIGVKFKSSGKVYSFSPGDLNPAEGSYVVVETARGQECGEVASRRHAVPDESLTTPLKPILRIATDEDMQILERNKQYMADAFKICEERIQKRELPMRLVDVECGFDSNKLIFYFTAESRVDFRELVKDLASTFHVRIELRQIGDRDEAKLLGGLGICGREFCCKGYLSDFQPITIKMAKEQGLALNPTKISGTCGRLMCCLRYESPVYEELMRFTPKVGSTVLIQKDPPVRAYVMEANLITGKLRVKPENAEMPITVDREDVERLQDMTRRMTKDDLKRDNGNKSNTPSKPPATNLNAAEQNSELDEEEIIRSEEPNNLQEQPEANAPKQRPQRQNNNNRNRQNPRENRPPRPQQQKPADEATTETTNALYSEFGETRQNKPQQTTVPHTPINMDEFDFTEHRAAKPQHSENAPAEGEKQPHGNRGGNHHYHRNPQQNGDQKPHRNFNRGNRNQQPRPNRPPQENGE